MIAGFGVIAAFMLWNAGLGAYHAGIEWKFWPGPAECSGPVDEPRSGGDADGQLQNVNVVRCDEAAWRFLGISLARLQRPDLAYARRGLRPGPRSAPGAAPGCKSSSSARALAG